MNKINQIGNRVILAAEIVGLLIIAISTIIAIGIEVSVMVTAKTVTLADLLLLFIYLEVLAMVGIYLKTEKLPVRIPLYIAIVAIARYLILDIKNIDTLKVIGLSGAILILAISILAIRYGHIKFPYDE